jgi:CRP-like cAMP-binding protein
LLPTAFRPKPAGEQTAGLSNDAVVVRLFRLAPTLSWSGLARPSIQPLAPAFVDVWILGTSPRMTAGSICWCRTTRYFPQLGSDSHLVPLEGMSAGPNWPQNRLLLALPSRDLKKLLPKLEQVPCRREQVLIDADSSLDHVYFPDSGVVSVVAVYSDGSIIEMATIGREGCTAVQAIFGAKTSSARFFVQIPGSATKMSRVAFTRAMRSMPAFRRVAHAYVQAFLEQVMVSAACNGAHGLDERLARWLLMMRDRSDGDTLMISQVLLAEMLGVQRPSVTNAAAQLERAGAIVRGRRQLTIVSRQRLMAASCECYQLVRTRIAQHLPRTYEEQ